MADGRVPSCVYGAEHLIRMFVKLPELLAVAVGTEQQAANVAIMVQVRGNACHLDDVGRGSKLRCNQ